MSAPIEEIASALDGRKNGNGYMCKCPAHEDKRASLHLSNGDKGVVVHCHAGCTQEDVLAELRSRGLWNGTKRHERQIVATYDYCDEHGALVSQAVRYSPKDFRQRRPDGAGGWVWKMEGVPRLPYKLPELLAAIAAGETVYIAEGEKDADNLRKIGLAGTCNAGGAGKWNSSHSQWFGGAKVIILPDNDDAGRTHAQQVATSLAGIASTVKIVELAGLPSKGDVSDWLAAGGTRERLEALVGGAMPDNNPAPVPPVAGPARPAVTSDSDHYSLANAYIDVVTEKTGRRPVYSMGSLYRVDAGLWIADTLDQVAVEIGSHFGGLKFCRRGGDFNSIAKIVAGITGDGDFFSQAPVGVAAGDKFFRVQGSKIIPELLAPEHRQCMRLRAEPDFKTKAALWNGLLTHAFADDTAQLELLQVLFGAALIRALWLHRIAVLLLGKTTTGKTTLLNVLASMFPRELVSATNPQKWSNEYYRAALAGKALNIVGELDGHEPIPGGAFKQIVGCDTVEGRHPTHRPFSFTSTAAHFFNANKMPPTLDRSDAFFKRWRIIEFQNIVDDGDVIEGLAERIIAEEQPAVLAWMLEGGAMLQASGSIPETEQHKRLIAKWRAANNSALLFLLDSDCKLDPARETKGTELYEAYRRWSADNGLKAFGRNSFFEAIDEGAGRIGVQRVDHAGVAYFRGVRLWG